MTEQRRPAWPGRLTEAIRLRLWWLLAVVLLLVALYVVLGRQFMSMVPDFREPLESLLVERIDLPLEIGELQGRMDGLTPVFEFRDVRIPHPEGEAAPLELERVDARLSVLRTLLHREPRLDELRVSGAALHLSHDPQEGVRLLGLEDAGPDVEGGHALQALLEPLYRQRRLVFEDVHAIVDWTGMPRIETRDLRLEAVRTGGRYRAAVRLTMEDEPLTLEGRFHMIGQAWALNQVNGRGYLRARGRNLHHWIPVEDDGLHPEKLSGELELWSRFRHGEPVEGSLRLGARDLLLAHPEVQTRWALTGLAADAHFRRLDDGYRLQLDRFSARTGTGLLETGPMVAEWRDDDDEQAGYPWRMRLARVDLSRLREQLLAWPFPLQDRVAELRDTLEEFAPGGQLEALHLEGRGDRPRYVSTRLRELAVAPGEERPGFEGLSGWLAGDLERGMMELDSEALVVHLPGQFRDPMTFRVRGPLAWDRDDREQLVLSSGLLTLDNPDAEAEALFSLHMPEDRVPELRLRARLSGSDAANAARYIPLRHLDDNLADWLANAFHGGRLRSGRVLYEGPVLIDSDRQQDRTQQMIFDVEDVRLHFADDWPMLEETSGRVRVHGASVEGRDISARLQDTRLEGGRFAVPEVPEGDTPWLELHGDVQGPAVDLDMLLRETPLADDVPEAFRDWELRDGRLVSDLHLQLPLAETPEEPRLEMGGQASGVELGSGKYGLTFTGLSGAVDFSLADGLQVPFLSGKGPGGGITGSVVSDADETRVSLGGELGAGELRERLDWPALAQFEGSTIYGASLVLPRREEVFPELVVRTSLEGLAVDAPAPLGKPSDRALPLTLHLRTGEQGQTLAVSLAEVLQGQLAFDDNGLRGGHLHLGAGPVVRAADAAGLHVDGDLETLDLPAWVEYVGRWTDGQPVVTGLPPLHLDLQVGELALWNLGATAARLQGSRESGGKWEASLDSETMVADLVLPEGYRPRGDLPLALDIRRLHVNAETIANGDTEDGEEDRAPEEDVLAALEPRDVPVADVSVADLVVNGTDYGRWEAAMRPLETGVRLEELKGDWRHSRIEGQLEWLDEGEGPFTRFEGAVSSEDLAGMLRAWDLPPFIESADASATYDLRWSGSPMDFDYLALQGSGYLEIHDCLLPGRDRRASALQLLGLVNIDNITRRLRLDFSDVFRRGLSCDRIRGGVEVDGSRLSTDRLSIRSPQAHFIVSGSMDIEARTLDHEMEMVLPLSSNLYAGCLAGPAACAGIFMIERLWGDRLERYTTLEYRVTGPWDDPEVEETRGFLER